MKLAVVGRAVALFLTIIGTATFARSSRCEGAAEILAAAKSPVPEPFFTETITDIDGFEPGEAELELNGSELRAVRGGAFVLQSTVELEWLVTRSVGLRLEPAFSRSLEFPGRRVANAFGGSAGLSWKLLQDFERDIYVQCEVAGRLPLDTTVLTEPGESALPTVFDVRSAVRRGGWTLRGSIGAAAGGMSAHIPVRGGVALLTGFGSSERYGFWGVEADIDGTRQNPTVLALNFVPQLAPIGLPFRLGLAIPWVVGAGSDRPSTGVFLRILFESAREYEYSKTGE